MVIFKSQWFQVLCKRQKKSLRNLQPCPPGCLNNKYHLLFVIVQHIATSSSPSEELKPCGTEDYTKR